jgi:diguanylate cyclase (GGDEF)-like protein
MNTRRFDDIDEATFAVMDMLRERLGRDCRLVDGATRQPATVDPELAVDVLDDGNAPWATIVVPRGETPLSAADRSLVELSARLMASIAAAEHRAAAAETEAETDPLTGLFNRRGWDRRLRATETVLAYRDDREISRRYILAIDIDNLKQTNDREGHAAGDALLKRAAAALLTWCGDGIVARIGGDEFTACVTDRVEGACEAVAAALRAALAEQGINAAVGCCPYAAGGSSTGTWAEADRLLCEDKRRRQTL